jgi:MoxR-like ATPase
MINQCFEQEPRFLLIDQIEDLNKNAQASLLSLLQDGCLVETKVSKTRSVEFKCSVIATCNSIKKLHDPLLSRFAVIEMKPYSEQEFKSVTLELLKDNPLAEYIAEQVWNTNNPNIRECVRIGSLAKCEQDVLRYLRMVK